MRPPASTATSSITTSTPPTPAAHALDLLVLLQLLPRHAADARAVEVGLFGLDASQTAQLRTTSATKPQEMNTKRATHLLIALLLPLRDQIRIRVAIFQQPVVESLADGFFLVVEVVDISRACADRNSVVRS